ncbi:MAG: fatty acid desaturase [Herminiimonas sp.]|nr:fatty acid desaturase [Herminiimonas sp.]
MSISQQSRYATKAEVLRALAPFAKPGNAKGLVMYSIDFALYWLAIAAVIFAPWLALKIIASVFAGLKLSSFVTMGHDAGHKSLVKSTRLNRWLGIMCFIPCMHNYRLWIWDHYQFHHLGTNGQHFDSYTPFSKADFDMLPRYRQVFERIIRSPTVVGFGIHYFFQRMLGVRIFPTAKVPKNQRGSAWRHFALVVAYHVAFVAALYNAPAVAQIGSATAVVLGYIVPFFVFCCLTGGSLYLMHTHRRIPWFRGESDTNRTGRIFKLTATNLTLPGPLSHLVHNIFSHSAHHAHAGVPTYNLRLAQQRLDELLGDDVVVEPLSLGGALATLKACKLYDYENNQWLDFDGRPTAPAIRVALEEDYAAAA